MGADRKDSQGQRGGRTSRSSLHPLRAFAVLLVIASAGGVILASAGGNREQGSPEETAKSPGPSPMPRASRSPSPPDAPGAETPSEREVHAIFRSLRTGLERAYRQRNLVLLGEVVERGSPQFLQSRRDISLLESNNLLDRTRVRILEVSLVAVEPNLITVRERALVRPRYIDDATFVVVDVDLAPTKSASHWTIARVGDSWKIVESRRG